MFSRMRRLVLACICTSALAGLVLAGSEPPSPLAVASREVELTVARRADVYLVLSPAQRVLEVRARGVTLDRIPLVGIELISQQRLIGRSLPAAPSVPAKWVVRQGPGDLDREVIAPEVLRPMPAEDEEEPDPPASPPVIGPTPSPTPTSEPPVSYRVQLDNGWDLWITDRLPRQGFFSVLGAALRDGWQRWRGRGMDVAPAVTLLMAAEDARRVHHLFRTDSSIIVTAQ